MKKLQSLGKKLTRNEMKTLVGGISQMSNSYTRSDCPGGSRTRCYLRCLIQTGDSHMCQFACKDCPQ